MQYEDEIFGGVDAGAVHARSQKTWMSILLYHKIEPAVILEGLVLDTLVQLFSCENAEFMC